jgi:hypothetical protein
MNTNEGATMTGTIPSAGIRRAIAPYRDPDGTPFARGINSVQLVHDGSRWWIHSITWDYEREDNPLPPEAVDR